MSEPQFPQDGILWRKWSAATAKEIADKDRPVLLFVADPDPLIAPFLKAIFGAMPRNERLRSLLDGEIVGLFLEAGEIPQSELGLHGAGENYHIAILSPSGLTPLVTFPVQMGDPDAAAENVARTLERILKSWI